MSICHVVVLERKHYLFRYSQTGSSKQGYSPCMSSALLARYLSYRIAYPMRHRTSPARTSAERVEDILDALPGAAVILELHGAGVVRMP